MKTVLVLSCIVLGITAYNFDDPIYNQFLAKDFESLSEEDPLNHLRARRASPPSPPANCPKPPSQVCCGAEEIAASNNAQRGLRKQCFKEVTGHETFHGKPFDPFNCEDIEKRKKELICVENCVGKKKGITDDNGNLKETELRKHVIDNNKFDWLTPKLDGIITKCIAEAKEATKNMDKSADSCNPASLKFSYCLFREVQMNCPADKIDDMRRCEIVRGILNHSTIYIPHQVRK